MYAIIANGSHQYRVEEGLVLEIQRTENAVEGNKIEFDRVLFVGDADGGSKVGQPVVAGARVTAAVLGEVKGDKLIIRKFKRRKGYALKKGHRQKYMQVKIEQIQA